jgi:hypothetical protein
MPQLTAALVLGLAIAGCEPPPRGSDEAMATTGPNQVVIKVPGMT